jgi:hypothetical protein
MLAMIKEWPVISRKQIGDFGLFSLTQKKVRSPRTGEIREVQALQFSDWGLILALTPHEEVVMVRQYRHGTEHKCYFYLAKNAVEVQSQDLDAGEDIERLKVPLKDIPAKIENREIDHGMVLLAFFFLWMKQGRIE